MNRKRKSVLLISGLGFIFILVLGSVIMFISEAPYRNKLPGYPNFRSLSKPVQKQIVSAGRKTFFNPSAANLGKLGMIYNSCALYEKAEVCYQLAIQKAKKQDKRNWIWNYYLGFLNIEQGDAKAAIANFTQVIDKNPGCYQALFYAAQANLNIGSTDIAEKIFSRLASLDEGNKIPREYYFPLQTYAMYHLSRLYMSTGRYENAEKVLQEIIKKQWTFGPAYRLLGDVWSRKGNSILGKKYIIRSNDLQEYSPPPDTLIDKITLISRSDRYLLRQIEEARNAYNFNWAYTLCTYSLKYIPENKYLLSNAIMVYFTLGKDKEVLPLLDRHLEYYRDDFEELMKLADLLFMKGFEPQAMNYFNQAKKLQPGSSRLALWLQSKGKTKDAALLLNEQFKKDPTNEKIITDLVHFYLNLNDKEKMTTCIDHLKKRYPNSLEAKKATGLLLEMEGKTKEALSLYEALSVNDGNDLAIFRYLNMFYLRNKMWDKAILNLKSALDKFPNDPDALDGLGSILITCPDPKFRNINSGCEYSERAFIHFKSSPPVRLDAARNLATAYAVVQDKQNARRFISIAMKMAGDLSMQGTASSQELYSYFQNLKQQYNL